MKIGVTNFPEVSSKLVKHANPKGKPMRFCSIVALCLFLSSQTHALEIPECKGVDLNALKNLLEDVSHGEANMVVMKYIIKIKDDNKKCCDAIWGHYLYSDLTPAQVAIGDLLHIIKMEQYVLMEKADRMLAEHPAPPATAGDETPPAYVSSAEFERWGCNTEARTLIKHFTSLEVKTSQSAVKAALDHAYEGLSPKQERCAKLAAVDKAEGKALAKDEAEIARLVEELGHAYTAHKTKSVEEKTKH